ncbi:MAG: hypothetical protein H6R37_1139, partial [Deltaproteobacteria bacterium]|nr:hypothetical protein [Deltaproteobacteria bacterium]
MNRGRTIFSQVMKFLPHKEFAACVAHYGFDAVAQAGQDVAHGV